MEENVKKMKSIAVKDDTHKKIEDLKHTLKEKSVNDLLSKLIDQYNDQRK